jgi:hypothetical protein
MAKSVSRGRKSSTVPSVRQPTVLYPVVTRELPQRADYAELSQADIGHLEVAAGFDFKPDARRKLQSIAAGWISHDRVLQSPRPKKFRARLQKMEKAAGGIIGTLDLDRNDAPILDRHLLHWLINSGCRSANDMLAASASLIGQAQQLVDLLRRVQQNLPADRGRRRPMDEDRFIIYLADQFEASGGQARAYASEHSESGYGETPFRKFVHQFYKALPIKSRRKRSGLDESILRALEYRRHHSTKG